ncbi:MAG: RNA methyltransferase [Clostridiales bacterium]|nr:RNA methyltransferase [Clostridiales bacterium]
MDTVFVTDLDTAELAPYARLTEAQLRRAGEAGSGLFIAESANVIESALQNGYEPVSFLTEEKRLGIIATMLEKSGVSAPVYTGEPALLEKLTGYRLSRGMLCCMKRKPPLTLGEAVSGASRIAVLEGVGDPENVGSVLRSAAALGFGAVLVSSSCCDPLHRRAARVSMGAVFRIPWAELPCLKEDANCADIGRVSGLGFTTAAMALTEDHIEIDDPVLLSAKRLAVVLGSEGNGLSKKTVAACDHRVTIPMARGVDSLNVAAASAIAFWTLSGRR